MNLKELDKYRVSQGPWGTRPGQLWGLFFIPTGKNERFLGYTQATNMKVICAPMDAKNATWEHVSVSLPHRCPTWDEMCKVKNLFWDAECTVVQFHPKESEYVNNCTTCLHLWRRKDREYELPPTALVGIK